MALSVATALTPQPATAIRWQVADLAQLPYATDTFSVVVCVHVLPYHLKAGIARAMLELRRVLQPGGWLYIDLLDRADAEYGCGPQMEPNTFLDLSGVPMHFSASQEIDEWLQGLTLAHSERRNLISSLGQRVVWEVWATK